MSVPPPAVLSVAVTALVAVSVASWAALGSLALAAAGVLAAHAALRPAGRLTMLTLAAALAWACVLALGWHFAHDHFVLRYVWLYSSAELPLHLKIANLWGGDEGTTLLLAACCLSLAAREACAALDPTRWSVSAVIAAWYGMTALWLAPFAATPVEWLAQSPSQGMNAHLMKPWMLFHAPLVLAAYAWTLSLAAPALDALRGLSASWPERPRLRARQNRLQTFLDLPQLIAHRQRVCGQRQILRQLLVGLSLHPAGILRGHKAQSGTHDQCQRHGHEQDEHKACSTPPRERKATRHERTRLKVKAVWVRARPPTPRRAHRGSVERSPQTWPHSARRRRPRRDQNAAPGPRA
mgnify:CR=1 FL=1